MRDKKEVMFHVGLFLIGFVASLICTDVVSAADKPDVVTEFDGSSIFFNLGNLEDSFEDEASISFWLKLNEAIPQDSSRTGLHHLSGSDSISHYPWSNGLAYLNTFRSSRVTNIELSEDIDREQWHMLTITTRPGEDGWRMYQNDELIYTASGDSSVSLDYVSVIGACHINRGPDFFFDGYKGDILLYNRVLTQEEVSGLYRGEDVREGLIVHWPDFVRDLEHSIEFSAGKTVEFGPVELRAPEGEVEYQWYFDGKPIEGATATTLTVEEMTEDDTGWYYVKVDDAREEVTPVTSTRVQIAAADWPMWRFNPARTANTPHALPEDLHLQWVRELPEPKRAWRHQWDDRGKLDFDVSYSPIVKGDKVFVPSNVTDSVTAYRLEDGVKVWQFYANGPVRLAPAAWGGSVYFTSDDGHLYCVDAEDGELRWKFQAGPSDHHLLGNERIISFWAARGAPVIKNGVLYFAAGLWPMHGVFVYALDAESGEVKWVNDTTSSDYVRLPHAGARGYGGLVPQGYLAVDGDRLVVAGGRAPYASLNRHTGELKGASFRAKPVGGYAVHAGGAGFRRNEMLEKRVKTLSDQFDGEIYYKLGARDRLIFTTDEGTLYCFGPKEVEAVRHEYDPLSLEPGADRWAGIAGGLLEQLGESEGYALMLKAGSGDLLMELLRHSNLHIVVVEEDKDRVVALRDELAAAGKYGRRAAVIEADPATFSVQPYLFSLIVSEDATAAGLDADKSIMARLLDNLRPYGGIAWLGAAKEDISHLHEFSKDAGVDKVSIEKHSDHLLASRDGPLTGAGQWTHQYSDSANTNFSADTLTMAPLGVLWFGGPTNDNILPRHGFGPMPQISHGRVILPGPETISARCVYTGRQIWEQEFPGIGHPFTDVDKEKRYQQGQGVHMTRAAPFVGANMLGSPYVSMADYIYVRYKACVYRLDAQSGEIVGEFQLPVDPQLEGLPDWGHISVAGDRLITSIEPKVADQQHYSQNFQEMEDIKKRALDGISSSQLVVMDRYSGEVLWTRQAETGFRHNAIIAGNGRVYLIDGLPAETAEKLMRRGQEHEEATLMAIDIDTGEQKWSVSSEIFGTWLGYSKRHDILIEGGRQNSGGRQRRLDDEPVNRAAAHRGSDGTLLWRKDVPEYHGPLSIHNDTVYLAAAGTSGRGRALHLKTGEQKMRTQSQTGEYAPWTYHRRYGCGTHNVSEHLITFRSGSAGFFDLEHDSGTGTLSGFRSGCTNNLIVADGVLSAPDYTRTCYCSYAHQTSLALIHMPHDSNIEFWTRYDGSTPDPEGYGINYGAPGRRIDPDSGRTWHDEAGAQRRHPSAIKDTGGGIDWVAASLREGSGDIIVDDLLDASYCVRLIFAELDDGIVPGKRLFDVIINGEKMLEKFDIVRETGAPLRGVVTEFTVDGQNGKMNIRLERASGSELGPVISGIELKVVEKAGD